MWAAFVDEREEFDFCSALKVLFYSLGRNAFSIEPRLHLRSAAQVRARYMVRGQREIEIYAAIVAFIPGRNQCGSVLA